MAIVDIVVSLKIRGEVKSGRCVICQCTENRPCPKGCMWVDPSELLCSACLDRRVLAPYWLGLITVQAREAPPAPPVRRIAPHEAAWYWRAHGAKLWHRELVGERTVCGLRIVLRDRANQSVHTTEPPGKLCANCERMQDAESVRPLLRKEKTSVQTEKRKAREGAGNGHQARR